MASLAGQAPAAVELDAGSLPARRGLLQQAVLASAVPSRRVPAETEQPVRQGPAAVAAMGGEGLRVVLRTDSPALAGLP